MAEELKCENTQIKQIREENNSEAFSSQKINISVQHFVAFLMGTGIVRSEKKAKVALLFTCVLLFLVILILSLYILRDPLMVRLILKI